MARNANTTNSGSSAQQPLSQSSTGISGPNTCQTTVGEYHHVIPNDSRPSTHYLHCGHAITTPAASSCCLNCVSPKWSLLPFRCPTCLEEQLEALTSCNHAQVLAFVARVLASDTHFGSQFERLEMYARTWEENMLRAEVEEILRGYGVPCQAVEMEEDRKEDEDQAMEGVEVESSPLDTLTSLMGGMGL